MDSAHFQNHSALIGENFGDVELNISKEPVLFERLEQIALVVRLLVLFHYVLALSLAVDFVTQRSSFWELASVEKWWEMENRRGMNEF